MTETVKKLAPEILDVIKKSESILLHCHPSPDPDSVGSALAMKFALQSLGKKVTIIAGDSPVPSAFSHFPGFAEIIPKNFFEIDLAAFDLFIIQDSGSLDRISKKGTVVFPDKLKTVLIEHHITATPFAKNGNLIDATYPATALILFDLFKEWGTVLTPQISENLFVGIYTDTGGFKFVNTTPEAFLAAAELTRIAPNFHDIIFKMENGYTPEELRFKGLALNNIETFLDGHLAIAAVGHDELTKAGIGAEDTSCAYIANQLKSVVGWDVGVCVTEFEPGKFKGSLRTRDAEKYDLSKIALALGGGGHKAAAGMYMEGTFADVKQKIVDAVKAVL